MCQALCKARTYSGGSQPGALSCRHPLVMSDGVCSCHNPGRGVDLHLVGKEERDAAAHPAKHRMVQQQKMPCPNASGTEDEQLPQVWRESSWLGCFPGKFQSRMTFVCGWKSLALDTPERMAEKHPLCAKAQAQPPWGRRPSLSPQELEPFYFLGSFYLPPALSQKLLEAARTSAHHSD